MPRTAFITFEGGEGAGKTTLIRGLQQVLTDKGCSVLTTREPGGSSLGKKIRRLLLDHDPSVCISPIAELMLFLADRAQHISEVIKPALEQGKIVLCDRFNDSTIVYQGIARGLGKEKVRNLCNEACQNFNPNLTFYLDLDPAIGFARAAKQHRIMDRMESEGDNFHKLVRAGFLEVAQDAPERIVVIDASQSPQELLRQVLHRINMDMDKNRGVKIVN